MKIWPGNDGKGERELPRPLDEVFMQLNRNRYWLLREYVYWGVDFDELLAGRGLRFDHEEGKLVQLVGTDNSPRDDEVGDLRS